MPQLHPNVVVIDWAELGGDAGDVLDDDGVSLTDDGLKRLPLQTAAVFGRGTGRPGRPVPPTGVRRRRRLTGDVGGAQPRSPSTPGRLRTTANTTANTDSAAVAPTAAHAATR